MATVVLFLKTSMCLKNEVVLCTQTHLTLVKFAATTYWRKNTGTVPETLSIKLAQGAETR